METRSGTEREPLKLSQRSSSHSSRGWFEERVAVVATTTDHRMIGQRTGENIVGGRRSVKGQLISTRAAGWSSPWPLVEIESVEIELELHPWKVRPLAFFHWCSTRNGARLSTIGYVLHGTSIREGRSIFIDFHSFPGPRGRDIGQVSPSKLTPLRIHLFLQVKFTPFMDQISPFCEFKFFLQIL